MELPLVFTVFVEGVITSLLTDKRTDL
jgi:hypothetical protein